MCIRDSTWTSRASHWRWRAISGLRPSLWPARRATVGAQRDAKLVTLRRAAKPSFRARTALLMNLLRVDQGGVD
eukprot:3641494-Prymnesium_polylepis.1